MGKLTTRQKNMYALKGFLICAGFVVFMELCGLLYNFTGYYKLINEGLEAQYTTKALFMSGFEILFIIALVVMVFAILYFVVKMMRNALCGLYLIAKGK